MTEYHAPSLRTCLEMIIWYYYFLSLEVLIFKKEIRLVIFFYFILCTKSFTGANIEVQKNLILFAQSFAKDFVNSIKYEIKTQALNFISLLCRSGR